MHTFCLQARKHHTRQPPRQDYSGIWTNRVLADTLDHAIDHEDNATDNANLHLRDRVDSEAHCGAFKLDTGQLGRLGKQGFARVEKTRCYGPPKVSSIAAHKVERRRSPEVDDDAGSPVFHIPADTIGNAVGPHL